MGSGADCINKKCYSCGNIYQKERIGPFGLCQACEAASLEAKRKETSSDKDNFEICANCYFPYEKGLLDDSGVCAGCTPNSLEKVVKPTQSSSRCEYYTISDDLECKDITPYILERSNFKHKGSYGYYAAILKYAVRCARKECLVNDLTKLIDYANMIIELEWRDEV